MKINFILPHLKNAGGVKISLTYAELLVKMGHQVNIISPSSYKRKIKNIFIKEYKWFGLLKSRVYLLRNLSEKNIPSADVTIADSWKMAKFLLSCEGIKNKVQLIQHDERLFHGDKNDVEAVYRSGLNKIVVSSWLEEIFKKEFNEDVFKLLNPIDVEYLNSIRNEKNKNINILLLAHSYKWKGTKEGVEIVNKLKAIYPQIKLWLLGTRQKTLDFNYDEYFYNLSKADIAKLYCRADIFLCPSYFEGFGLMSAEAMACGCALVTYDNGGSRDFAFDNETAFVAENQDTLNLKDRLEEAIVDVDKRLSIASNGCRFINKMARWPEQSIKLEEYLQEIINR